jgi:hypothetical protein
MASRSRKSRSSIRKRGSRRRLFLHLKDVNCKTGKRAFATRINAWNALLVTRGAHRANASTAPDAKFTCVDVYKCKWCGLWHHTSKRRRKTKP